MVLATSSAVALLQRALGEEHVVVDVERREVLADHVHHGVDGGLAHERQPFGFGLVEQARAMLLGQPLADGLQVVARIEALRDRADLLAQRLAVAQEGRAGEHIDLRAGIVDVVLAGDLVAGEMRAARRAHRRTPRRGHGPHASGRSGLAETNSTLTGSARALPAPAEAVRCRRRRRAGPRAGPAASSLRLMKPGPAISTLATRGSSLQVGGDQLGQRARIHARLLGQHHGGVGGEIAMGADRAAARPRRG